VVHVLSSLDVKNLLPKGEKSTRHDGISVSKSSVDNCSQDGSPKAFQNSTKELKDTVKKYCQQRDAASIEEIVAIHGYPIDT
jgi:hypothetical protein